jgi:hypothetical protein
VAAVSGSSIYDLVISCKQDRGKNEVNHKQDGRKNEIGAMVMYVIQCYSNYTCFL